jgi:hypothetical protein
MNKKKCERERRQHRHHGADIHRDIKPKTEMGDAQALLLTSPALIILY